MDGRVWRGNTGATSRDTPLPRVITTRYSDQYQLRVLPPQVAALFDTNAANAAKNSRDYAQDTFACFERQGRVNCCKKKCIRVSAAWCK